MVISFYPQILSGDFFVELSQEQSEFQSWNYLKLLKFILIPLSNVIMIISIYMI